MKRWPPTSMFCKECRPLLRLCRPTGRWKEFAVCAHFRWKEFAMFCVAACSAVDAAEPEGVAMFCVAARTAMDAAETVAVRAFADRRVREDPRVREDTYIFMLLPIFAP